LEIGPFQWNELERQLSRDGTVTPLQPKVADTLAALLSRRGEIVEKAELMKLVWPDTTVEEVNLERNISLLRKALGDEAGWIETIPKRGYRLKAAEARPPVSSRRIRSWGLGAFVLLVVVVVWQFYLPSRFVQLKPGQAYLAVIPFEGDRGAIDESVVAELVKQGAFSLLNPSVVRRYRWVGIAPSVMARIVGIDLLLEGRIEGGRVLARLSDVRSGRVIWSESYPAGPEAIGESVRKMAEAIRHSTGG
jgi:hypothetical protein